MTSLTEPSDSTSASPSRGASGVAAGILLSRLAGLARERAFAYFFGTSLYADAWRAALRMPNVLQNLLGEGTLSASFIPIYAELIEKGEEERAGRFAGAVLGLLFVTAGALAFLGIVLAPSLVALFFMGFDVERQELTVTLVRILFPMTALLVLSAWSLGILNSHRRFFLSYVAPVFWNLAMIGTLVAFGAHLALPEADLIVALGWGALVGGALQLGVQLPSVLHVLPLFRPRVSLAVTGVREAIRNFIPVLMARGVVNLSGWLDYALAAFLATGAVAALGYAQTLYLLPISLFAMAVAASELPELSRTRGGGAPRLAQDLSKALERVTFFVVPSAVAYLFLGNVVVAALFQTGEFGRTETLQVHAVLAAYSLGLLASASSRVRTSAYYAVRDTRTPARIAGGRVLISLAVGGTLMLPMDQLVVGEGARLGAAGLALGATVAAWLEFTLLKRKLSRRIGPHGIRTGSFIRILAAAGVATGVGLGMSWWTASFHPIAAAIGTFVPFGVAYLALARALGVAPPLRNLLSRPG